MSGYPLRVSACDRIAHICGGTSSTEPAGQAFDPSALCDHAAEDDDAAVAHCAPPEELPATADGQVATLPST
jgi:hypothetical protein